MPDESMTPERIAALLEAATPGPWVDLPATTEDESHVICAGDAIDGTWSEVAEVEYEVEYGDANAALIAAAPDIARAYLAEHERAEKADGPRTHDEWEALRKCRDHYLTDTASLDGDLWDMRKDRDDWSARAIEAEAAIARARAEVETWPCGDDTCDGDCTGCAYARDLLGALGGPTQRALDGEGA